MSTENNITDQEYTEAFNQGYLIKKYKPNLFDKLLNGIQNQDHEYIQAVQDGANQCILEQEQSLEALLEEERKKQKSINQKKSKDRERGIE